MKGKKRCPFVMACCILGAVFVGVLVIEVVMDSAKPSVYATCLEALSSSGKQLSPQAVHGKTDSTLQRALPDRFEAELFSLAGGVDVRVSDAGDVVGFLSGEDVSRCFSTYAHALRSKGWTQIESGQEYASSFVKREGLYTTAFLSCAKVENETAVVVQLARANR
ncbi:MAG: hypothetical protein RR955_04370 [Raoultibacter sp.]